MSPPRSYASTLVLGLSRRTWQSSVRQVRRIKHLLSLHQGPGNDEHLRRELHPHLRADPSLPVPAVELIREVGHKVPVSRGGNERRLVEGKSEDARCLFSRAPGHPRSSRSARHSDPVPPFSAPASRSRTGGDCRSSKSTVAEMSGPKPGMLRMQGYSGNP